MEIKLETTLPVRKEDPNSFSRPVRVTVNGFDEQGAEYLVGQLKGDILHLISAEAAGHRMLDVFDCDVWEDTYRVLVDKHGNWRDELNFDLPIFELVVFYDIVLAPCTRSAQRHILNSVFDYFSCNTLIGLWNVPPDIPQSDLVALGFARLSDSKMIVRHTGNLCPFSRQEDAFRFPLVNATEEDEQWVRSRCN